MRAHLFPLRLIGAAALIAGLTGCSNQSADVAVKPVAERSVAPDFSLNDANGAVMKLADYKGKVVLLNFWATWCAPCKVELPWFQEFESKYKNQGFSVVGVSLDEEGWSVVKPYIADHKVNYRMVVGTEELSALYGGVASLPTTFMLDRDGHIAAIHTGLESKATYQKEIEQLLEGKGGIVQDASLPAAGRPADEFVLARAN